MLEHTSVQQPISMEQLTVEMLLSRLQVRQFLSTVEIIDCRITGELTSVSTVQSRINLLKNKNSTVWIAGNKTTLLFRVQVNSFSNRNITVQTAAMPKSFNNRNSPLQISGRQSFVNNGNVTVQIDGQLKSITGTWLFKLLISQLTVFIWL